MIREAVVAGAFYPGTKDGLILQIKSLVDAAAGTDDAIGVLSPHAGYIYSGEVAGSVLSSLKPRDTYVILGPNHTGLGLPFGLSTSEGWRTPLGEIKLDKKLAVAIKNKTHYLLDDELSHSEEHSIEVQLPFLQFLNTNFKIVPISVSQGTLEIYRSIGSAIAGAIRELGMEKSVTIIASSDMTHYESQEEAKRKDAAAIDAILKLDEKLLMSVVERLDISMCGYAPAVIMIAASKALGAKSARLVKYQTSGDASGDYTSVVGYAGITIR